MHIETHFTYDKVRFDQENEVHLAVTLKAPKTDWQDKRPAVCIIPVIDISSSMSGEKLEYAKQSVIKLIDHLKPGDFCGVIAFEDAVHVLAPPMEMTQSKKDQLKAKVGELRAQACTNFSGGMIEGLSLGNNGDLPKGLLVRVIMFTDGQANRGVATKREELLPLLKQTLGKVTLSAFGYGADADQELLADLAKAGKGNYAFVKNPDDALSAFGKELGGLLSTYAQNLEIEVVPHNGHRLEEVISDVDTEQNGNNVTIKLPEILGEEERHIVVTFKLSKQAQALPRAMNVADVKITYDLLDEKGVKTKKTEEVKAKITFVKEGDEQKTPTEAVMKIVGIAQVVKIQIEAESYAKRGDFKMAFNALQQGEDHFIPLGMTGHSNVLRGMKSKMADQQAYASNQGYLNSMKSAGTRSVGTSGMDAQVFASLGDMGGGQSASPAQEAYVASFTGGVPVGGGAPAVGVGVHVAVGKVAPAAPAVTPKPSGLGKKRSKRW